MKFPVIDAGNGPLASGIAVGVVSIEVVPIIEINGDSEGFLRPLGPLQDLFGPIHAQKAVHFTLLDHLDLGRVPNVIMSLSSLEFLQAVNIRTIVIAVLLEGSPTPIWSAVDVIVVVLEEKSMPFYVIFIKKDCPLWEKVK